MSIKLKRFLMQFHGFLSHQLNMSRPTRTFVFEPVSVACFKNVGTALR